MKIPVSRIDGFVARPDAAARAILLYGPDSGLVRERAERLARGVVPDLADPFRVVELPASALRDDPARLADEAAQMGLLGGRRVVRVRDANDAAVQAIAAFLEHPLGDALVLVEAGDLAARAKLRMLFEAADNGAALPCYVDDEAAVEGVVREMLRAAGLNAAPDALDYLTSHLGGDRQLVRREIEKLILFMGKAGSQVRVEDVEACIGDSAAQSLDDAVLAAAEGDARKAEHALARAFAEGETPVGAVRAAQRHFQRLHAAASAVEAGASAEDAADALKPKLFWKIRPRFLAQLRLWPVARVGQALERLTAAEIGCKSTGFPDQAIATRCFLELAGAAARRKRRA